MAMNTVTPGASSANPPHAPRVSAGLNSFAAIASTRRGVLSTIAAVPAVLAATAIAIPRRAASTTAVETMFAEWKAVKVQIEAWPDDDGDEHLWDRMRALERSIRDVAHSSVRAAEISLWVSLPDLMVMDHEHKAILREDIRYLQEHADDPEPAEVILINAIASLRRLAKQEG